MRKAGPTKNFARLVRRLIAAGRCDEVAAWIRQGIEATGKNEPGTASEFRTIQRDLWVKDGDRISAAAIDAGEFLDRPSYTSYRRLEKSSCAAGVWDAVGPAVRNYLETGMLPGPQRGKSHSSGTLFSALPDTGLFLSRPGRTGTPFFELLIEIAIAEKRPDEVLAWFDKLRSVPRGIFPLPYNRVANAVVEKFPDRALAIWMERAESMPSASHPKSYESSLHYLEKIRALLKRQGRSDMWEKYLAKIRIMHARKKKFIAMLAVLGEA